MRKTKLLASCLLVFVLLLSLYPTVLAKPKDDRVPRSLEVPPAPEDYWNYEDAEGTIVANGPDFGPHWRRTTTLSSDDYYHAGAWTNKETDGIRAYRIYVTNPQVPHPSDDFFAAWIMVDDEPGMNWFQVGWTEYGTKGDKQIIFVQHGWGPWPQTRWTKFYEEYPISPGMYITVELRHTIDQWTAWLYWNNEWVKLVTRTLAFTKAPYTEQFGEAYTDTPFYVPDTRFYSIWLYKYVPHHGLRYYLWDTYWGETGTVNTPPYYAVWTYQYWDWRVHYSS